ncbi:hypothetical protein R1sor_018018 [Riccia sorocarpa]|uniref:Uncharacterized protein n=1 Tax=Riccia sorocarpa TaxID=122646 RepID=A0ABD3I8Y3_9MARC
MCNFCHIRNERRAVQAVPEEGESDEEFEEDESSKSRNLECEYVHLIEEMRDLFEEEESSRGTDCLLQNQMTAVNSQLLWHVAPGPTSDWPDVPQEQINRTSDDQKKLED